MISRKLIIHREILNPDFVVTLAKACSSYNSSIIMYAKEQAVNLKSIVNIFGARLDREEEVEFVFSGSDEEDACREVLVLIQDQMKERVS